MRALKLWCLSVLLLSVGVALLAECRAYDRDSYARFTDGGAVDASSDARDGSMDAPDVLMCPTGLSPCNGTCVDLTTSPANCGMCGRACPGTTCSGSQCTNDCVFARLNCDGNTVNGCETSAATDHMHCGSCANACADTEVCNGGTCHTLSTPGGPCTANGDCSGGLCLTDAMGYPGGYCSGGCNACPTGTVCEPNYGYCLARCSTASDCRTSGYLCVGTAQGSVCVPDCTQDTARTAGICGAARCDALNHVCNGTCGGATSDCSTGSTCDAMRCRCSATTNCGVHRACVGGTCGCADDSGCPQGQHCDATTGLCS